MAKAPIRKPRKKVCLFCQEKIAYVDYKDTPLLRKFISDRGKIRARRVTGNCTQHQRAAGGPELDRRRIEVPSPIKTIGAHQVRVRLHPEVTATIEIEIVGN